MGRGTYCIVCRNDKENLKPDYHPQESLFKFPPSPRRRSNWIQNLQLDENQIKSGSRVCEKHFSRSQLNRTRLKPDAVPALQVPRKKNVNRAVASPLKIVVTELNYVPVVKSSPLNTPTLELKPKQASPKTDQRCKQQGLMKKLEDVRYQRLHQQRMEDKRRIIRLKARVTVLKQRLKDRIDIKEVFSKNETFRKVVEAQVERYKNRSRSYSDFEKTAALSLYYSCGLNGYQTLRKMGLLVPVRSTLLNWTREFRMLTGVNPRLLSCIQQIVSKFAKEDLDCLITWDEMSIKEFIEFNKYHDMFEGLVDFGAHGRTLEAANEVLVFMIRGINSNWQFPISYYFSKGATTSDMLEKVVTENILSVQDIGLKVRMAVCDMSFTNQGLYRRWGVSSSQPSKDFNDASVYFIHDTPHLIKLVRNNLMKHQFLLSNLIQKDKPPAKVKWSHITSFYLKDKRISSRMAPRLTNAHIYLRDFSKMRVKLATQLFSHSVYSGMKTMCRKGILRKEMETTAMFVKKIDEIFDFLNMSSLYNDKPSRCAVNFYSNIGKLDDFLTFLESISIPTMGKDPDFLKGLHLTVSGIQRLALDLQKEGYTYIYTRNLQQDCLENYFALVRSKGGYCKNPTARGFRTNFRFLFFATLIHTPSGGNTESTRCTGLAKYVENMQSFMYSNKAKKCSTSVDNSNQEESKSDLKLGESFYSIKVLRNLKLGVEQEAEVAAYMGAASIKAVSKLTKCISCQGMLVYTNEVSKSNFGKNLLINFKLFDGLSNSLAYLRDKEYKVFQHLATSFYKFTCKAIQTNGENVLSNIIELYCNDDYIKCWLNDQCHGHKINILRYFLRAKMFRLIKDKNDTLRQLKSWGQTRRDLRNQ